MLTLTEMADHLDIQPHTVKNWHHAGIITGHPFNDKGECLYPKPAAAINRPTTGRPPKRRTAPTETSHSHSKRSAV